MIVCVLCFFSTSVAFSLVKVNCISSSNAFPKISVSQRTDAHMQAHSMIYLYRKARIFYDASERPLSMGLAQNFVQSEKFNNISLLCVKQSLQ